MPLRLLGCAGGRGRRPARRAGRARPGRRRAWPPAWAAVVAAALLVALRSSDAPGGQRRAARRALRRPRPLAPASPQSRRCLHRRRGVARVPRARVAAGAARVLVKQNMRGRPRLRRPRRRCGRTCSAGAADGPPDLGALALGGLAGRRGRPAATTRCGPCSTARHSRQCWTPCTPSACRPPKSVAERGGGALPRRLRALELAAQWVLSGLALMTVAARGQRAAWAPRARAWSRWRGHAWPSTSRSVALGGGYWRHYLVAAGSAGRPSPSGVLAGARGPRGLRGRRWPRPDWPRWPCGPRATAVAHRRRRRRGRRRCRRVAAGRATPSPPCTANPGVNLAAGDDVALRRTCGASRPGRAIRT